MPTELLPLYAPTVILQNVLYGLPAVLCNVIVSAACETSINGSTWAPFISGTETSAPYIRCPGGTATVICKPALSGVGVPSDSGGGGGGTLPTDTLNKVLISQGAGVTPIFSDTVAIGNDLLVGISLRTLGYLAVAQVIQLTEALFASAPSGQPIGTLANISNSTVTIPGTIIVGGGANHVLARYDGANWRVVASDVVVSGGGGTIVVGTTPVSGGTIGNILVHGAGNVVTEIAPSGSSIAIGSTPITGGVADKALIHGAGDVISEVTFTGTVNVVRSASPTFTGTVTFANIILGSGNNISMSTRFLLASSAASQLRFANAGDSTGIVLDFATDGIVKVLNRTGVNPADLQSRSLSTIPNTVANLPAAPIAGMRASVTDSNATLTAGIGAVVAAGGSNKVPVYYDGTSWLIG